MFYPIKCLIYAQTSKVFDTYCKQRSASIAPQTSNVLSLYGWSEMNSGLCVKVYVKNDK